MTAAPRPDSQVKSAGQEGRRPKPKPAVQSRVQFELVDKQNNGNHTYDNTDTTPGAFLRDPSEGVTVGE